MNTLFLKGFILTCLFAGSSLHSAQKTQAPSPQSPSSARSNSQKREDAILRKQMPVIVNIFLPEATEPVFSYNYQGSLSKSSRQVIDLVIHADVLNAAAQPRVPKLSQSSSSATVATNPPCSTNSQSTKAISSDVKETTEPLAPTAVAAQVAISSMQRKQEQSSQSSSTATTITTPLVTTKATNESPNFKSPKFINSFSPKQTEYLMSWQKRFKTNNTTISNYIPDNTPLDQTYEAICNLLIKKYPEAFKLLGEASKAKCNDAKTILAYCYRYGIGTQQDDQRAQETLNSSTSYQEDPDTVECSIEYLKNTIKLGF